MTKERRVIEREKPREVKKKEKKTRIPNRFWCFPFSLEISSVSECVWNGLSPSDQIENKRAAHRKKKKKTKEAHITRQWRERNTAQQRRERQ